MKHISLLGLLLVVVNVSSYSNGPPIRACESMIPEHDGGGSLSTDTPYTLAVSDTALRSGGTLRLKFSRSGNLDFRGFFIQARDEKTGEILGSFTSIDRTNTRKMNCLSERRPPDAISHNNGDLKSSITATWTSPEFYGTENRTAIFYFTVVYSQNIFWAKRNAGHRILLYPKPIDQQKAISESAAAAKELPSPYLGCGKEMGCFGFPGGDCVENSNCQVIASYKYLKENKRFDFTLSGKADSNSYLAAGFSSDAIMGDDLVVSCRKGTGGGKMGLGWNDGRNNVDRQIGLAIRNYEIRESKGLMVCKFQVNEELVVSRATTEDKLEITLTEKGKYYLLLAKGALSSDGTKLTKHTSKSASSSAIDFTSTAVSRAGSPVLFQLHGVFMVIAWLGCASVGMVIARYYKNTWTKVKVMEKDLWFMIHQGLMSTAVVLTLLSFIFIASKVGFFPYDSKFISDNAHPVLGGLTLCLSIIQPIMGALRPHREASMRRIFNWVHWGLGNLIYIFAMSSIFLAVDLENAKLSTYVSFVLLAFLILQALIHIGLSVQAYMIDEDTNKVADSNGNMRYESRHDQVGALCRKITFGFYLFLVIFIVLFMIVVISDAHRKVESHLEYLTDDPSAEAEGEAEAEST